ncbi:AraC family transcriptional regulator [Nostoc ellipsosporum NOK]|jgi:AraC-like DNA-binding protein|nr:AraC family transcriptional regulator [Nostoc ellipsosporum NOK]
MLNGKVIFENEVPPFITIRKPSPALADIVSYYFEIDRPGNDGSMTALPGLNTLLAVPLANSRRSFTDVSGNYSLLNGPRIYGSLTHAGKAFYTKEAHEFSIKFQPGVLTHLLQIKPALLQNNHLAADRFFPTDFMLALRESPSMEERMIVAEKYLSEKLKVHPLTLKIKLVQQALQRMNEISEAGSPELAAHFALSIPTLNRYFRETLGLSPRQCYKLLRFRQALQAYRQHGSNYVYKKAGYTDFSHFARNAHELTRHKPSML